MQFWDNIVHAALLGTDKKQLKKDDLPGDLAEASTLIATENDKESFYLGIAVIAASYRKCGVVPINKEVTRTVSNEESKVYCSNAALTLLNDIMSLDNNPLLLLWLQQCNSAGQLVLPELIPTLFDLAMRHKALQQEIVMVTGERGEWLRSLNRNWQFDSTAIDENIWETGSLDQRKWLLRELGKTDPAKAKELLRQTWAQENANTKSELLKQLTINVSEHDVEWFEQLLIEKSQKVKDEATKLLKLLPTSSIVQKYWTVVKESIHIKKEKGILGIGTKTILELQVPSNIEESIFKSGIEKLSSEKNTNDNDFVLYQLISAVPPVFFEDHFKLDKETLIEIFLKTERGKSFITAFGAAAITFKDISWLRAIITVSKTNFIPRLLNCSVHRKQKNMQLLF